MLKTLERADIDSINFGGYDNPVTEVRGYQNYDITDIGITSMNNPGPLRPWTDTKIKSEFFQTILDRVQPKTYADFGNNLGYYVFHAAFAGIESTGVDYNKEYISVCECLKARHDITNTSWLNSNLELWSDNARKYDLLTVFNVIHHLYNRTEQYKNMDKLVRDFAHKGRTVLFEFPTERDKKGYKWTMGTNYSQKLFEESLTNEFSGWEIIPGQTEERPYYLCNA